MKKESRTLVRKGECRTAGLVTDAVCQFKIWEMETGKYEVVLKTQEDENYRGKSVSNNFEEFAKKIKDKHLPRAASENIEWKEHLIWSSESYEDQVVDWKVS